MSEPANPLLHRPVPQYTRQVVIDYMLDTITTTEGAKVESESLSRNPHWRSVDEARAFYERLDYKLVEDTEVGLIYEKSTLGKMPSHERGSKATRFMAQNVCPLCGAACYKKSIYCKKHYRELSTTGTQRKPRTETSIAKANPTAPPLLPGPTDAEILGTPEVSTSTIDEVAVKDKSEVMRAECPAPCGQVTYRDGLCIDHYRERQVQYKREHRSKQNLCKHAGCIEPRLRWKHFCQTHQDLFVAGQLQGSELYRKPAPTKTIVSFGIFAQTDYTAYDEPSWRLCSCCLHGKPASEFDTSKDSTWGVLNFTCRQCEAKREGVGA